MDNLYAKTLGTKWVNNLFQLVWREPNQNLHELRREPVFKQNPNLLTFDLGSLYV